MQLDNSYIQLKVIDEERGMLFNCYDSFSERFPDFICQICLCFVRNPVECATCNYIFCKRCVHSFTLYSKHCPNRCTLNFKPVNRILNNMINQITMPCPFCHKGCQEQLRYEQYEKHIVSCEYAPYMCSKCEYVDSLAKVVSHCKICKSTPPTKRYVCKHCGIVYGNEAKGYIDNVENDDEFVVETLYTHEYLCIEQFIVCNKCDKRMTLRELRKHTQENLCLITQLNNKIKFLNDKIRFYEREYDKGGNADGGNKTLNRSNTSVGNVISNSNSCKTIIKKEKETGTKDVKGNNNASTNTTPKTALDYLKERKKMFEKEEINDDGDGNNNDNNNHTKQPPNNKQHNKLTNMEIVNTTIHKKESKLASLTQINSNPLTIISTLTNNSVTTDVIPSNSSTSLTPSSSTTNLPDISNKSSIITSITPTNTNDYFITTDNSSYFLYNSSFTLIKTGKPVSSAITCAIPLPYDNTLIAVGTISSNVLILNPYKNNTVEVLLHSRKKILSLAYIKNLLISSSTKENAFYLWKPPMNAGDKHILKTIIKEHTGWVWTMITPTIEREDYLITGSGDKRVILWKVYEQNESCKSELIIKGHSESVMCLKCICYDEHKKEYIIASGSYDGVVRLNTIELNSRDKSFTTTSLINVYNKDDIVNSIVLYKCDKENKVILVINCEGYEGYSIVELEGMYS